MKNIVIIGGGTGTFTLLKGLREFPTNNAVIVSTADDGGSGGALRNAYDVIPPGDFRQCLVGLSYTDEALKNIFQFRFAKGPLAGHTVGNILLTAAELETGDAEHAIAVCARLLNVRGEIIPVSKRQTVLSAKLDNGKILKGEHIIDEPQVQKSYRIKQLSLSPTGPVNPKALGAIKHADAIVFGPGDLFTSVIPSLLVKGVKEAVIASGAKKILVTNIMTKFGQTNGFVASDFLTQLEKYIGKAGVISEIIVNSEKPAMNFLKNYNKEKSEFVKVDSAHLGSMGVVVITAKLVSKEKPKKIKGDVLNRSVLRHDSNKLAKIIWQLVQ